MKIKNLLIFALLAVAGSLQAQTDSIAATPNKFVGIWHYPEDHLLVEITENTIGVYGSKLFNKYKILSENKLQVISSTVSSTNSGRVVSVVEYKLSDDGNTFIVTDDDGEKFYAQKVNIQPNTNLVGKYAVSERQDATEMVFIEILDESNAMIGYYYTAVLFPMKYVVLENHLLLSKDGKYRTFEVEENGLSLKHFDDESDLMFYKTTDDFDHYQFFGGADTYAVDTVEVEEIPFSFAEEVTEAAEIETEETTNKKSFNVSYPSGHTTKYTVENIGLEVDKPIIYVRFWEENYIDGEWRYASSKSYYLYYKENKIQKIEKPGLSWNCLEDNPREWVIAFKKFANEVPSMLDKRTKDVKKIRKLLWDSGQDIPVWTETYHEDRNENEAITVEKEPQEMESDTVEVQQIFICPAEEKTEIETATEETTARTTTITVLDGTFRLELSDKKTDFRCIKMDFVDRELNIGMGSCLEIKKRDGFYITNAWNGKKYTTIDALIKDELKESFKDFYDKKQHKKRGKEAWAAFVSEGGLQLFLDFANEIIDDEFLNSPFNEIYG